VDPPGLPNDLAGLAGAPPGAGRPGPGTRTRPGPEADPGTGTDQEWSARARVRPPADAALTGADLDGPDGLAANDPTEHDREVTALFSGTREIRTGRRADLRRELNEVRRLRTATVVLLVLAVLGAPLAFYAVREAARDPVFGDLAALEVPGWAARDPQDETSGSRWCIGQCRLRQRIMRSERTPEETSAVYTNALRKAGWVPWKIDGCPPEGQQGFESCWQRDEYVLDLWVYQPECEVQLKTPDPNQPATPLAEAVCPPTVVTIKIINKVSFEGAT
jgi:hypothetical protein